MTEHELKTWMPYWADVNSGAKTVEIRRNDRDYQVGDTLLLREWDQNKPIKDLGPGLDSPYTGRVCRCVVTHVLTGGQFGLQGGYVALSISTVAE